MTSNLLSKPSFYLHLIFFLIIATSALTYLPVSQYALNGHWYPDYYKSESYISLVPIGAKISKDIFIILLLIGSLIYKSTNNQKYLPSYKPLIVSYILCFFTIIISILKAINSDYGILELFYSLRPILFLVSLFLFCHRHFKYDYLSWMLESINLLALIQIFYSCLQRYNSVLYNGVTWLNLGITRSVGTFIEPNTMGLFMALVFYINLYILPPKIWRFFLLLGCAITIFFSNSRAALMIILFLAIMFFYGKVEKLIVDKQNKYLLRSFSLGVFLTLSFYLLEQTKKLSIRGGESSTGFRLEIFMGYFNQTGVLDLILGKYIGFGSNVLQTLNNFSRLNIEQNFFLADSTWASVISQFGMIGLLLLLSTIYFIWKSPWLILHEDENLTFQDKEGQRNAFLIYVLIAGSTTILFENYASIPIIVIIIFWLKPQLLGART